MLLRIPITLEGQKSKLLRCKLSVRSPVLSVLNLFHVRVLAAFVVGDSTLQLTRFLRNGIWRYFVRDGALLVRIQPASFTDGFRSCNQGRLVTNESINTLQKEFTFPNAENDL
jgi:hypothetical protein